MEKIFTNKSIWKKIVVAILIVMAFNVIIPIMPVFADGEKDDSAQDGDNVIDKGILMRPIMSLLVSLGDGAMYLMNSAIMGGRVPLVTIWLVDHDDSLLGKIGGFFIGIGRVVGGFFAELRSFSR